MNKYVVALVLLVAVAGIAREKSVNSNDELTSSVRKNPLTIALFYTSQFDKKVEREYGNNLKMTRRAFESTSKIKRYEEGGVAFVSVDLAKKRLADVKQRYGIGELPTYMLFYRGVPLKSTHGKFVQHRGFLEKNEISNLIERHFGKSITGYLKERARLRQREREESRSGVSPYLYWGGGYPYAYPYYYPPYGGAGFGLSIGL